MKKKKLLRQKSKNKSRTKVTVMLNWLLDDTFWVDES